MLNIQPRLGLSYLLCTLLLGCTSLTANKEPLDTTRTSYSLDKSHTAIGQSSRVRHIVIHYTSADTSKSLYLLTQTSVSSHYLISDESPPRIYQLVDENKRAWHAGESQWHQYHDINTSSVGIEIVNSGRDSEGNWHAYQPKQIELLIALLNDLVQRHKVSPANIVGHSDIAPLRKIDPGPLFPWKQLAEQGLGRWYNPDKAKKYMEQLQRAGIPSARTLQKWLKQAGYPIEPSGVWDLPTKKTWAAFQMHYRPARYDGLPDIESAAILKALIEN